MAHHRSPSERLPTRGASRVSTSPPRRTRHGAHHEPHHAPGLGDRPQPPRRAPVARAPRRPRGAGPRRSPGRSSSSWTGRDAHRGGTQGIARPARPARRRPGAIARVVAAGSTRLAAARRTRARPLRRRPDPGSPRWSGGTSTTTAAPSPSESSARPATSALTSPYALAYGRQAKARALTAAYARPEGLRWLGWAAHNSLTRATWDAVGGFDESYSYREDTDLGIRLADHGVRLVVDPALEVEHRGAAADTATRAARAWVSGASEVLFAARHPAAAPALATPPGRTREKAWSAATGALGCPLRGRTAAARAGALTDRVLPALPAGAGGRAVALVVEASARSGRRRGATDQQAYRAQKDAELAAERRSQR